uniref:Uncharacterized protein n=1 Tax=Arundo donax TaxID=35708 RepID=A0A0A8ZFS2_ARUDO
MRIGITHHSPSILSV